MWRCQPLWPIDYRYMYASVVQSAYISLPAAGSTEKSHRETQNSSWHFGALGVGPVGPSFPLRFNKTMSFKPDLFLVLTKQDEKGGSCWKNTLTFRREVEEVAVFLVASSQLMVFCPSSPSGKVTGNFGRMDVSFSYCFFLESGRESRWPSHSRALMNMLIITSPRFLDSKRRRRRFKQLRMVVAKTQRPHAPPLVSWRLH